MSTGQTTGTQNPGAAVAGVTAGAGPPQDGQQDVVLTLQRHLLPAGVPVFPQVRLAARHLVARQNPGGGCFDVFALAGGTIALMVGSAVSDGPGAVAAMSELRTVLREALLGGAVPGEALSQMDEFAARTPGASGAAVGLALLDPATWSLRYTSAGQPPPLVWDPAGRAEELPAADGGPLGTGQNHRVIADAIVPPGAVLVMCSDGRGPDAPRSPEPVTSVFTGWDPEQTNAADRLCTALAETLADRADGEDVTVLAAHHLPGPGQDLAMRLPAEPTALRQMRARLRAWLDALGTSALDRVDTELAVYEAAANAIMHGRPERGEATVSVQARLDGTGGVLIEVTDLGRWRVRESDAAQERTGGRGLSVISKVTAELTITPSPDGTTVIMRRALSHPASVDRA